MVSPTFLPRLRIGAFDSTLVSAQAVPIAASDPASDRGLVISVMDDACALFKGKSELSLN